MWQYGVLCLLTALVPFSFIKGATEEILWLRHGSLWGGILLFISGLALMPSMLGALLAMVVGIALGVCATLVYWLNSKPRGEPSPPPP